MKTNARQSAPQAKWPTGLALAGVVVGMVFLPLAGAMTRGQHAERFLRFPFGGVRGGPVPVSWLAFVLLVAVIVVGLVVLTKRAAATVTTPGDLRPRHPFPRWGWAAAIGGGGAWFIAWTRVPVFATIQPFTYLPLWLCFIVLLNGLTYRRCRGCLLTHQTAYFLLLFAASAPFWWLFEYCNQFARNWYYTGNQALSPVGQLTLGTLSFATVLPGVMSLAESLEVHCTQWSWLSRFICVPWVNSQRVCAAAAGLAGAGLYAVGIWPDFLFPMLWVAPLVFFVGIQGMLGSLHILSPLAAGDWRRVCQLSAAGLLCGICWEMWNQFSLLHWQYTIPWVGQFKVFEMPVLGYAGYVPFGLECGMIADAVRQLMSDGTGRSWDSRRKEPML